MVGYLRMQDFTALAFAPLAILQSCGKCIYIPYTFKLSDTVLLLAKLLLEGKSWGRVCKSPPLISAWK